MKLSKRIRTFLSFYFWIAVILAVLIFFDAFSEPSIMLNKSLALLIIRNENGFTLAPHLYTLAIAILVSLLPSFFFISATLFRRAPRMILITAVLMGIVLAGILLQFKVLIPPLYLYIALLGGVGSGVVLKMIYSATEQEFLRLAFSQFVSEEKLKELLRDPDKLRLEGKDTLITVLFMDIRGFTAYTEKNPPVLVVSKLNDLLDKVTEIIVANEGVVDKYMGDGVMAIWGAPSTDRKQASKACKAALEIKSKIQHESEFEVGVGIHHGTAIVGNMGSRRRYDYTAIGDTVNTAARLESATKEVGSPVLISEAVKARLQDEGAKFDTRDLGRIKVKGKTSEIHIFGLVKN